MTRIYFFIVFLFALSTQLTALAQPPTTPIKIIAAENFYGEVAKELGGEYVQVDSILQNPTQDPHLFTTSPSIAKHITQADIVVYNGAHYDDWMVRLLAASDQKKHPQIVVVVAALVCPEQKPTQTPSSGVKANPNTLIRPSATFSHKGRRGFANCLNPHIWYLPSTMTIYANALSANLAALDPAHKAEYTQRLLQFQRKQADLQQSVAQLRQKIQGLPATATEPVFNDMAEALGLSMRNLDFQWSIENEISPSPSMLKRMQQDLKTHQVRVLFYNRQVSSPLVDQIKSLAEENHIPVIGVTETQPPHLTYHEWMQQPLQALEKALGAQ